VLLDAVLLDAVLLDGVLLDAVLLDAVVLDAVMGALHEKDPSPGAKGRRVRCGASPPNAPR
jgi:hypothetical protein